MRVAARSHKFEHWRSFYEWGYSMFRILKGLIASTFAAVLLLAAGSASAVPITYQYWGEASGTLDGRAFQNAGFLITAQSDTGNIGPWCCSQQQNTHSSATIALSGFGTMSFSNASQTWTATNCCGGIGANLGNNWLTLFSPAMGNYTLGSNFGPLFDPMASTQNQFTNVATSMGLLTINSLANGATFQATVVPEPGTWALMAAGLAAMGLRARRRR
jgi:hypothetical protein